MAKVNRYRIVLYGASEAAPDLKAKVELYSMTEGASTASPAGKIRFYQGTLPIDQEAGGTPEMSLPADMLGPVVDVLRRESPVYFAYHEGRAVLGTGVEPIGSLDDKAPRPVRIVDGA